MGEHVLSVHLLNEWKILFLTGTNIRRHCLLSIFSIVGRVPWVQYILAFTQLVLTPVLGHNCIINPFFLFGDTHSGAQGLLVLW